MKKSILWLVSIIFIIHVNGQGTWTQRASLTAYNGRQMATAFAIGNYGYIGTGATPSGFVNDFWKWDQTTNTWTAIANYPGAGEYGDVSFVINGNAYTCFGWSGSFNATDLWEYNPGTNAWTQKANFPGLGRYGCFVFVLGTKAYIGCGEPNSQPGYQDVWVYDAVANTWTQLSNFPSGNGSGEIGFTLNGVGYAGCGGSSGNSFNQMYKYNPITDTWTPIANFPLLTVHPVSFVIGCLAYVGTGLNEATSTYYANFYSYSDVTNTWTAVASLPGVARWTGVGYTINGKGYIGTGSDGSDLQDYWEYGYYTKILVSDTNLCVSDSVHFRDSSTFNATSWKWYFPGGTPTISTAQNPSVKYAVAGTYTVSLVLTDCGGTDSVSQVIHVIGGLGGAGIIGNSPICIGTTETITASGGTTYLWNTGATTSSIVITPPSTTTYSVQITGGGCNKDTNIIITVVPKPAISLSGNDTICSGNSTTITASGGTTYLWSTGATTNSVSLAPLSNTSYTVTVANGACSKDTTINIIVNTTPTLVIGSPSDTICSGNSVALNVSGANSYTWTPSTGLSCNNCPNPIATPTTTITYVVTGSGINGCTDIKNIRVLVTTAPVLAVIPNQNTCSGGHVTLVANLISGSFGAYSWMPGGSTDATITVSPNSTTTYTVQYSNACGNTSTTATVFVEPTPIPSFSADITEGCAPLCVQYRDLSSLSAGSINRWSWTFGDGDTLNEENPIYCYPGTGSFTTSLTTVSSNGCSATLQIDQMINVFSKPVANFIYAPQPINILEPTVQFTDKSTDSYGIAYRKWSFGDASDSISNLQNPSHTYQDTGKYCPLLIVENTKGCIDTSVQCLEINPLYTLYIPSAFTPNGDGANDSFTPKGSYIKSFEMYIFNRWDMTEVYHTTDITKGWNGTVNGGSTTAQQDNYIYKITATDWSNTQHSYVGEFTLLK